MVYGDNPALIRASAIGRTTALDGGVAVMVGYGVLE